MKNLEYSKYHGCGNDFIIIDNRKNDIVLSQKQIADICHRRFGIGADGLMLLGEKVGFDFTMKYYNSDGNESSFCGNGGRCIVQFAIDLGIVKSDKTSFEFENTTYSAEIFDNKLIALSMINVEEITRIENDVFFNTGSPHYIHFVEDVDAFDLIPFAKSIRYSDQFPEGINVNIVEPISEYILKMRTYERGVEDETYSCGTGVTAAAIAYNYLLEEDSEDIQVRTKGGNFQVNFNRNEDAYTNVKLIGPAKFVFKGEIEI
jgi:diaminopimelate epimerase